MPLLYVKWQDAYGGSSDWKDLDEITDEEVTPTEVHSVGWLIGESRSALRLIPHVVGEKDDRIMSAGCGEMTIPKKNILSRKILDSGDK